MRQRRSAARLGLLGAGLVAVALSALYGAMAGATASSATPGATVVAVSLAPATQDATNHRVGHLRPGFVGVSMEYCEFVQGTVDQVSSTGGSPVADPALAALIGALAPGQRPVLRIGGDSTDLGRLDLTAPAQGGPDACPYRPFAVNTPMIAAIAAVAKALNARLILGLPLKRDDPSAARAQAAALASGIGPSAQIAAFEIGNEPDRYPRLAGPDGFRTYLRDFRIWTNEARAGAGHVDPQVAGPSLGRLGLPWITGTKARNWLRFVKAAHGGLLTFHEYPEVQGFCPGVLCPGISNLLNGNASHGLAESVAGFVASVSRSEEVRVDEMNSVTGGGVSGVSDTFGERAVGARHAL